MGRALQMGQDLKDAHRKLDRILDFLESFQPIFESIDERFALLEDSAEVIARDVSQARHNTHEIANRMQRFIVTMNANLSILAKHFSDIDIPSDEESKKG